LKALLIGASSLVVTAAVTPVVIVAARRWGVVDRPGALKPQTVPVPYLGGVAVFAGLVIGAAVGRPVVIIPLAAALGLGVADDRFDLPAQVRLLGQLAIGVLVVVICPVHLIGILAAVAILALVVLVINGVNLIDGLDMLAAGVAAVAGVGFAIILHGPGRQLAVALTGALLGFLLYNRPPARVYLGDGGSYLLGTVLSVLLVETWRPGRSTHLGVAALALVAVPVAEVAFAIVRRARSHRSLVAGDRGHPYDRLVARGWPRPAASLAYIGVEAALAAGAVIAVHQHSLSAAVLIDVAGGALLVVLAAVSGALHPDQEAHT
jgi:UDP-GlcNAc:undecaprenyl-phosphate/decaprenyl-phosphate GlcNAc-1-phosphate transferase